MIELRDLNETIENFRDLFGVSLLLNLTALYTFRDHNGGLLKIMDSEHVLILLESRETLERYTITAF